MATKNGDGTGRVAPTLSHSGKNQTSLDDDARQQPFLITGFTVQSQVVAGNNNGNKTNLYQLDA